MTAAEVVLAALDGRPERAEAALAGDPALAGDWGVALLLGDQPRVAEALAADPGLAAREVEGVGRRPLSIVCFSPFLTPGDPRADGAVACVALLLAAGAGPDETHVNEHGDMPVLYGACGVARNPEAATLLLDAGATPDDGESVYHASESPDTTCLALLLARGAAVKGTNALGMALDHPERVALLLGRGDFAPPDPELDGYLLDATVPRVAEQLVAAGAQVGATDQHGLTAYARAVRAGHVELAATLERLGAPTEVAPLQRLLGAAVTGDAALIERLLAQDPGLPARMTRDDHELLPRWASAGDADVVGRLVDLGVPLDARGIDGGTALHYAGLWGHPGTVAVLLARGADPELETGCRHAPGTALNWAAWGSRTMQSAAGRQDEYLAVADVLLGAGARPSARMVDGASDPMAARLRAALGG